MPMRGTLLLLSRVLQEVQNFKDKIIPVVHKLFKKTEKKKTMILKVLKLVSTVQNINNFIYGHIWENTK